MGINKDCIVFFFNMNKLMFMVAYNFDISFILQTGSKGKKEQERCNTLIEKLQDEQRKQKEHVERVLMRLKQVRNNDTFSVRR